MIPAYRLRNAVANSNEKAMRREWTGRIEEMAEVPTADECSEIAHYAKGLGVTASLTIIILAGVFGWLAA